MTLVHASPNFGERRGGATPDLIVLHYTAMTSASAALARLSDPETEVSAHYLIGETGQVWSMVPEEARAWHAGAGSWGAVSDVNSRSIGIELANSGAAPFAATQVVALEELLVEVMPRWSIGPERVIAHSDMAPERKIDPGKRFDWRRLALGGLSVWPEVGEADVDPELFLNFARAFGYPDAKLDVILAAMRLRFRPWAKGPLDARDMGIIADLARRFPVDATGAQV